MEGHQSLNAQQIAHHLEFANSIIGHCRYLGMGLNMDGRDVNSDLQNILYSFSELLDIATRIVSQLENMKNEQSDN